VGTIPFFRIRFSSKLLRRIRENHQRLEFGMRMAKYGDGRRAIGVAYIMSNLLEMCKYFERKPGDARIASVHL
jgi:hypothetical protein